MPAAAAILDPWFCVFLSAKGGVGRSLAALNVAGILAARGLRVLVVDLDLESGLSAVIEGARGRAGVVERILTAREGARALAEVLLAVELPSELQPRAGGSLHLLAAGDASRGLRGRLASEGDLEGAIDALRRDIIASGRFDHVVVDAPSGGSPLSRIAARRLADLRVVVSGLGRQHVLGNAELLAGLAGDGGEVAAEVVFSPVPAGEDALVIGRLAEAQAALAAAYGGRLSADLEIPYHPQVAVDEGLHLLRRDRGALRAAHVAIARRLLAAAGDSVDARIDAAIDAWSADDPPRTLAHLLRARLFADDESGWIDAFAAHFAAAVRPPDAATRPIFELILGGASGLARHRVANALGREAMARWTPGADLEAAERCMAAALEAEPDNAVSLGNYANFLCDERRDLDRAEAMYRRAIAADPEALFLCNFATFLCDERRDLDGAEASYQAALELDPEHALSLCNYATFLFEERGDAAAAEAMYRRAAEAAPEDPDAYSCLARLLLEGGRIDEGVAMVEAALVHVDIDAPDAVEAECWMYVYCCGGDECREQALANIRLLVDDRGVTTGTWSFEGVIRRAEALGHPEAGWLRPLAAVVAGREPASVLEAWGVWRGLWEGEDELPGS